MAEEHLNIVKEYLKMVKEDYQRLSNDVKKLQESVDTLLSGQICMKLEKVLVSIILNNSGVDPLVVSLLSLNQVDRMRRGKNDIDIIPLDEDAIKKVNDSWRQVETDYNLSVLDYIFINSERGLVAHPVLSLKEASEIIENIEMSQEDRQQYLKFVNILKLLSVDSFGL